MARHITYLVMQIEVNPTTFYLKVNNEYGVKVKKSETVNRIFREHLFKTILSEMYNEIVITTKGAVKISVNVSNFTSQHRRTLSLLVIDDDMEEKKLSQEIQKLRQKLRQKFGLDILKTGNEL